MMKLWLLLARLVVVTVAVAAVCTQAAPSDQGQETEDYKVVCYYGSWAVYRPGHGKFDVEDVDPWLCTHLIYTFVGLDETTDRIKVLDAWNDLPDNWGKDAFGRVVGLTSVNPTLKLLLAIGGWNEGSTKYSAMARDASSRAVFVDSCVQLLLQYGFHGLDLDWEYPANRGGLPEDKANFALLVKELRQEFDKHGLLLTAAVGMGPSTIATAYDVAALTTDLDFINLMTYDFHGNWDGQTGHHAPLYARPGRPDLALFNLEASVNSWIEMGAPASKLVLGMGLYGQSFTMTSSSNCALDIPTSGGGAAGPFTRQPGMLGYNEICEKLQQGGWTKKIEESVAAPFACSGNQFVGFEDAASIRTKSEWAKSLGLAGGMVWSIETDDFRGRCGQGRFPLLTAINAVFRGGPTVVQESDLPQTTAAPARPQPTNTEVPTKPQPETTTTTRAPPAGRPLPTKAPASTVTKEPRPEPGPEGSQESDRLCIDEGYKGDPTDCTIFFYCQVKDDSFVAHRFTCPPGLCYNHKIFTCDWPFNL